MDCNIMSMNVEERAVDFDFNDGSLGLDVSDTFSEGRVSGVNAQSMHQQGDEMRAALIPDFQEKGHPMISSSFGEVGREEEKKVEEFDGCEDRGSGGIRGDEDDYGEVFEDLEDMKEDNEDTDCDLDAWDQLEQLGGQFGGQLGGNMGSQLGEPLGPVGGMRRVSSCYFSIASNLSDLAEMADEFNEDTQDGDASAVSGSGATFQSRPYGRSNSSSKSKAFRRSSSVLAIDYAANYSDYSINYANFFYHDVLMTVFSYLDARSLASFSETARRPNFECFYFLELQLQRAILAAESNSLSEKHSGENSVQSSGNETQAINNENNEQEILDPGRDQNDSDENTLGIDDGDANEPLPQPSTEMKLDDSLPNLAGTGVISRLASLDPTKAREIVKEYLDSNSSICAMPLSHSMAYLRQVIRQHGPQFPQLPHMPQFPNLPQMPHILPQMNNARAQPHAHSQGSAGNTTNNEADMGNNFGKNARNMALVFTFLGAAYNMAHMQGSEGFEDAFEAINEVMNSENALVFRDAILKLGLAGGLVKAAQERLTNGDNTQNGQKGRRASEETSNQHSNSSVDNILPDDNDPDESGRSAGDANENNNNPHASSDSSSPANLIQNESSNILSTREETQEGIVMGRTHEDQLDHGHDESREGGRASRVGANEESNQLAVANIDQAQSNSSKSLSDKESNHMATFGKNARNMALFFTFAGAAYNMAHNSEGTDAIQAINEVMNSESFLAFRDALFKVGLAGGLVSAARARQANANSKIASGRGNKGNGDTSNQEATDEQNNASSRLMTMPEISEEGSQDSPRSSRRSSDGRTESIGSLDDLSQILPSAIATRLKNAFSNGTSEPGTTENEEDATQSSLRCGATLEIQSPKKHRGKRSHSPIRHHRTAAELVTENQTKCGSQVSKEFQYETDSHSSSEEKKLKPVHTDSTNTTGSIQSKHNGTNTNSPQQKAELASPTKDDMLYAMDNPITSNPYDHLPSRLESQEPSPAASFFPFLSGTTHKNPSAINNQVTDYDPKVPSGCVGAYAHAVQSAAAHVTRLLKYERKSKFESLPEDEQLVLGQRFIEACTSDAKLPIVKEMIHSHKMDVDRFFIGPDETETCPLHAAAFSRSARVLEFLCEGIDENDPLKDGGLADVNIRDRNGWTALHFAAGANCVESVRVLAEHGAELTVEADNGYTPFHWAERLSNEEVAKELEGLGADNRFVGRWIFGKAGGIGVSGRELDRRNRPFVSFLVNRFFGRQ